MDQYRNVFGHKLHHFASVHFKTIRMERWKYCEVYVVKDGNEHCQRDEAKDTKLKFKFQAS